MQCQRLFLHGDVKCCQNKDRVNIVALSPDAGIGDHGRQQQNGAKEQHLLVFGILWGNELCSYDGKHIVQTDAHAFDDIKRFHIKIRDQHQKMHIGGRVISDIVFQPRKSTVGPELLHPWL